MAKIPKSFCILPFIHHHVTSQAKMTPCCYNEEEMGNVNKNSMKEVFHNENFTRFRQQILSGELPQSCHSCIKLESLGFTSHRQNANLRFKNEVLTFNSVTESSGILPFYRPKFLDIRFSNFCNLKCRSCGPLASTTWGKEEGSGLYELKDEVKDEVISLIPNLSEIYFAGGEPLIIKENLVVVEEVKKTNPQMLLIYNTNLSTLSFHGRDYLEYWKGLDNVSLIVSLDEIGEKAEYLRNGLKFSQFLKNAHRLVENKIPFEFHVVVSVINAFSMREMLEFLSAEFPNQRVLYTLLATPTQLRLSVLPQELKISLMEELKELQKSVVEAHHSIIQLMLHELSLDHAKDLPHTLSYIRELDRRRGENFRKYYPYHPLAQLL